MTLQQKEFEELVKTSFKLLKETNEQVRKNALEYHKEHCINLKPSCERNFMILFLYTLSLELDSASTSDLKNRIEET